MDDETKQCSVCLEVKSRSLFPKGYRSYCKQCKAAKDKEYRTKNLEAKRAKDRDYYAKNAETIKQRSKAWYEANFERVSYTKQEYNQRNRDRIREQKKAYNEANKEWLREYMNSYQKHRYRTDIAYRIKSICNKRIRDCIRKTKSTLDITGCDISYLMKWFEYQFTPDMTWDNMGVYWHIDHVTPCASFDFSNEDNVFECYNWRNLRPLRASENISKHCKVISTVIEHHKTIVDTFISLYGVPKSNGNV